MQHPCNPLAEYLAARESELSVSGFSFQDLQSQLSLIRGRRIPDRTLYFWLSRVGIERDEDGYYSDEDLEILKALAQWLKRPNAKIDRFIIRLHHFRSQNHAD